MADINYDFKVKNGIVATSGQITSSSFTVGGNQVIDEVEFLQSFFGYPALGYDTQPRALAFSNSFHANNNISFTLFTPLKTFTASTISTMVLSGRSDYGYISHYRGMGVYRAVGAASSSNIAMTPLAVTWDKDESLWVIQNHNPGLTTTTLATSVASNSNNFTLVTCTGTGATFTSGQRVTVSGGSGSFTSFTGTVVGLPTATNWILQATGSGIVTGSMTGGSAVGLPIGTSNPALTSGSVIGGTGFVASVSIVHGTVTNAYTPGQFLYVNGASRSFYGYVLESPAPTNTTCTIVCPSTLTSGSTGAGTVTMPDAYGRFVRPLFVPTPSGSGVVTPTTVTFNAGTTYAIGFLISASGGTFSPPVMTANTAAHNTLFLPALTAGLANQTTITSASVQGGGTTANASWARLT